MATGCAMQADDPAVPQQRHEEEEERRIEALVAARLEQRLQQELSRQLEDVVDFLLSSSDVLRSAASKGKHELLGSLLRRMNPWQQSKRGGRIYIFFQVQKKLPDALLDAARAGQPQCLRLILDTCKHCPAKLNELLQYDDRGDSTALMLAAKQAGPGHVECVRLLLEHSPKAQVTSSKRGYYLQGFTALMYAAVGNCTASMQLLLAHSPEAQVAATDHTGSSALMHAAGHGHVACLSLLLAHSPEQQIAAVDKLGRHALLHAASKGHVSCVQLLLGHSPGAQITLESPDGGNALSAAAQLLLLNSGTAGGGAGAHQSALMAGRRCVELLVAHGAQLPDGADAAVRDVVRRVIQEAVQRSLVPDMANAAVVGLALAAAKGRGKRPAEGEEAAGPSDPKAARTDS